MKRVLRRSTLIFAVTVAFIGGMGFFAYKLVANSGDWVDQHYNYHIAGTDGLARQVQFMTATAIFLLKVLTEKEFIMKTKASELRFCTQ